MDDLKLEDYKSNLFYRVRYVSGTNTAKNSRSDYHNSINLIFIYFIKGIGKIRINNFIYEIDEGDVILLNPSELFLFNVENNRFHERIVLFSNIRMIKSFPYDCSEIFNAFYNRKPGIGNIIPSDTVKKNNLDRLFLELLDAVRDNSPIGTPLSICKIIEIMCSISKTHVTVQSEPTNLVAKNTLISLVLEYINKNHTKDICVQDIADEFHVHRSYLLHKFKSQTGISLWNYVIWRRIHSFNGLITENLSLQEAAFRVGFKNYSNFFRLYKKNTGITPLEFKQQFEATRTN